MKLPLELFESSMSYLRRGIEDAKDDNATIDLLTFKANSANFLMVDFFGHTTAEYGNVRHTNFPVPENCEYAYTPSKFRKIEKYYRQMIKWAEAQGYTIQEVCLHEKKIEFIVDTGQTLDTWEYKI